MAMTDPIADMLTRIRNANSVFHDKVDIPASNIKIAIADVLKREGYIKDYRFVDDNKQGILTVLLKYGPEREKVISGIKRISRPGFLRQYSKRKAPPRVLRRGAFFIPLIMLVASRRANICRVEYRSLVAKAKSRLSRILRRRILIGFFYCKVDSRCS